MEGVQVKVDVGLREVAYRHADVLHRPCGREYQLRSHNPHVFPALDQIDHGYETVPVQNQVCVQLYDDLALGFCQTSIYRARISQVPVVAELNHRLCPQVRDGLPDRFS